MRRQKKYTSERQILEDIDRNNKRIKRLLTKAEANDGEAELLAMADDASNGETIRQLRVEADELRKEAEDADKIRGQKLKNTLSAFKTETLPLDGVSHHVVLQNIK